MYGIPPDGASLDEESIIDLFGSEFQQILAENLQEVRNGDREPKELEEIIVNNPSELPNPSKVEWIEEPFIKAQVITKAE